MIIVLAGPAGVGKGTVVGRLLKAEPKLKLSVSATTRSPRPGEIDGVHYEFVSAEEFDELVANSQMLEWAWVHQDHRYGTTKSQVAQLTDDGFDVILEIDLDGARQIRKSAPEAFQIFIAPPSWEELERRLRDRGTETEDQIQTRLATARAELAAQSEFDVVVINDDLDKTVQEVLDLVADRKEAND